MPIPGPVAIILAAGHGKRMVSERAKVLHELCGLPMVHYVIEAARAAGVRSIIVVVGVGADQVRAALADQPDLHFALQEQPRGTGDAVRAARPILEAYSGPALVLAGDMPLIRSASLTELLERQRQSGAACVLATAQIDQPYGFGRILRDGSGRFLRIIEQRDCTPDEALIREINPSCYVFELPALWSAIERLGTSNAQGEYYLTDAPELLQNQGLKVEAIPILQPDDVLGINTREHLAEAHQIMQSRIASRLMSQGVTITDPRTTSIDGRAQIGPDTTIFPFTVISGRVRIGRGCKIGPFTHLRDGTILEDHVEVGAFVETSASALGSGTVARHLAYLGNAQIAHDVNVGAGTITANFDGQVKQPTIIESGAFLGAGSIMIAPVTIGEHARIAAGAVVTARTTVPAGATVMGMPARVVDVQSSPSAGKSERIPPPPADLD
jgi:bifunctional UDP-N-acetylglucosamine pyrophosphorylase/glucosamine-1-phosphate N-acetyltransferase